MRNKQLKQITLPPINPVISDVFTLDNVAGRDAIAAQIEDDIDSYCLQQYVDGPRSHLGASKIGHECERHIWFHFRWMFFEKMHARKARYFDRGHREEERIIEWLTGIGFNVISTDVDGKQIRILDCDGHLGGSCDGNTSLPERYLFAGPNDPHHLEPILLEFKTAGAGTFPDIRNTGVRKAQPQYWSQCCVYAHKLNINYVLFIAVSKNDDDLDVELLEVDHELAKAQLDKALFIINSQTPPRRISEDASFWKCKMCDANEMCHLNGSVQQNCRSCKWATPAANKQWQCNQFNAIIPSDFIPKGCEQWTPLPR